MTAHRPVVDLGPPCMDCGTPTYCGAPHGADPNHDHSTQARACTRAALERAETARELPYPPTHPQGQHAPIWDSLAAKHGVPAFGAPALPLPTFGSVGAGAP